MNRRKFIGTIGMATLGPSCLVTPIMWATRAKAQAAEPKRYIYIQQPGAPARWMFDLFLNPGNQGNFVDNPHMVTEFTGDPRYTGTRYRLIDIGGTMVPPIWNFNLPAPGGTTRKLRTLLANMVHIRGIDTGNAGHSPCQRLHFRPLGARTTVTAITGDYSNAPLPAIDCDALSYEYESVVAKSFVSISRRETNYISSLLTPFQFAGNNNLKNIQESYEAEISDARTALNDALVDTNPTSKSIVSSDEAARKLLKRDFPDFDTTWTQLTNKYEDLISRALRAQYPGISNKPVGVTSGRDQLYQHDRQIVTVNDLRNMIKPTTHIDRMAKSFALAEFVVTHDLSTNIAINPGFIEDIDAPVENQDPDEHNTGTMISLFLDTLYYCALGSCLLELVAVLKTQNKFDNTVVDVSGEFNRKPRENGTGSDHGFTGASVAMYSGAVTDGPFVIGDIRRNEPGFYRGTWGEGVDNAPLGGTRFTAGHFAATVAFLLKVPSPVTAVSPLLKEEDGKLVPTIRQGRIVA